MNQEESFTSEQQRRVNTLLREAVNFINLIIRLINYIDS